MKYKLFSAVPYFLVIIAFFLSTNLSAKSIKDFYLEGPVLIKADWSSELLRSGDLNDDGMLDFLTVNNRLNRIEVFFQTENELLAFEQKQWPVERVATDAQIYDLNGDGKDDILLAGNPCKVLFQDKDGSFDSGLDLDFEAKYLFPLDLNEDDQLDLLVVKNKEIILCVRGEDKKNIHFETESFPSGHSPLFRPELIDLNDDGREDLAFVSAGEKDFLIVRDRNSELKFNPEKKYRVGATKGLDFIKHKKLGALLAAVEDKTDTSKLMQFKDKVSLSWEKFPFDELQQLPFDGSNNSSKPDYVLADLNRDKRAEIFRFDSETAELKRFRQDKHGAALFDRFPTLTNIVKARYVEFKNGKFRRLVCISPDEETFGIISENKDGKIGVPSILDVGTKPLIFDIADMDGDGVADLVFGSKQDNPLQFYKGSDDGTFSKDEAGSNTLALDQKPDMSDVSDLRVVDLNNDGAMDLVLFFGFASPQVYLQDAESGEFKSLLTESGLKRGLFNKLNPNDLSLYDFDGDGSQEIVLLKKSYARVIAMDAEGEVELLAQFNGESSRSNLSGIVFEDLNGDDLDEVVLLDRGNRSLTVYEKDAPDKLFYTQSLEGLDCLRLNLADINGDGADDLVIENRNSAGLMLRDVKPKTVSVVSRNSSEIEEGKYAKISSVDLNNDGEDEVLLMEKTEQMLEFFQVDDAGDWQRFYKFKFYQGDGPTLGYFKINEALTFPRQFAVVDYNKDKTTDLVVLVHDNIILYPQKERDEK